MYEADKDMSRAVAVKKPQESQKAKSIWKMKAAEEAGEEYHDPKREDNIKGRNETRLALWEEHLKDQLGALDKDLKCVESQHKRSRPKAVRERVVSNGCCWLPPKFVEVADMGGHLLPLGSDGECVFTHSVHGVERARKVRAAWRALLLLPFEERAGDCAEQ